jgi:hypothetical protein
MADLALASSEFDIFAPKPVQNAIDDTYEVVYKPLAPIDQSDLEFLIPADLDTYVNPDIKLYQKQIYQARWKRPRHVKLHCRGK